MHTATSTINLGDYRKFLTDNSWWLFWAPGLFDIPIRLSHKHFNECSKELSFDLKEHIIDLNKSGKSLGAIPKQLQVSRSTVHTTVWKCKAQLCHCHDQEENKSYHMLLRKKLVRKGQESTKTHQKASLQWIESCWKWVSVWAERLLCKKEALSLDAAPQSSTEACCCSRGQRKKPSSSMFRGEKAQPYTPRIPYPLSSMVLVVLCCGAVLLPVDLLL